MRIVIHSYISLLVIGGAAVAQSNAPVRAATTNMPAPAVAVAPPPVLAPPAPVVQPASVPPPMPDVATDSFWRRELATARRIVGGRTYDITPLVRWHMQPSEPERPLKAWVLVIGTVGANTAYGWDVTGFVDGQRLPSPFIIRNPPTELLSDFNRSKASYASLQRRQAGSQVGLQRAKSLLAETQEAFRAAGVFRFAGDALDLREQAVKDIEADMAATDEAIKQLEADGLDSERAICPALFRNEDGALAGCRGCLTTGR
ncbi:MAG: hypothetical protein HC814_00990 [Rhodobacteraceae bacterium]|nr:hypothetical protein [Paracoccaceae bacterium]